MIPFALEHHALVGCRLRPLAVDEAVGVASVLAGLDPWATLGYDAEALARYLIRDDPALRRFVAEQREGRPAGLLAIRTPWLRGPSIELLAVFPDHQRGGLGGMLVEWAGAQAMAGGNLWACVSAFNGAARRFYAGHGFVEVAHLPDLVAEGESEILLRRQIAAHATVPTGSPATATET